MSGMSGMSGSGGSGGGSRGDRVDHAASTRAGGREVNEDYVDVLHGVDASCWVVADGLGGHRGGAVASKLVVESALRSFQEHGGATAADVERHVQQAQDALLAAQRSDSSLATMRSTIVVLVVSDREAVWGHVGDSRLYHLRGGRVISRTRDHSVSQALVDGGQIDQRQQGSHEDRSRLLRSLGKDGEPASPTIGGPEPLCRDDAFVLCTDGFWEALDETAIEIDYAATEDAASWIDRLTARLLAEGVPLTDNYTVAAVRVTNSDDALPPPPPHDVRRAAGSSSASSSPRRSSAAALTGALRAPEPPGSAWSAPSGAHASGGSASTASAWSAAASSARVLEALASNGPADARLPSTAARRTLFGEHRATVMRVLYALMALTLIALLYTAYVAYTNYTASHGSGAVSSPPVEKDTPPKSPDANAPAPVGAAGDLRSGDDGKAGGDSAHPTQPVSARPSDPDEGAPGHLQKDGKAPAEKGKQPEHEKVPDPNAAASPGASGHLGKGDDKAPAKEDTQPAPRSRDPNASGSGHLGKDGKAPAEKGKPPAQEKPPDSDDGATAGAAAVGMPGQLEGTGKATSP